LRRTTAIRMPSALRHACLCRRWTGLRTGALAAVIDSGRAVAEVAAEYGVVHHATLGSPAAAPWLIRSSQHYG
jgi:transposase-like protein